MTVRHLVAAGLLLAATSQAPAGPIHYSLLVTPVHSARPMLDARGLTDPVFRTDTLFPLPAPPQYARPSDYWLENWGRNPLSPTGYNPYTEDVDQEAKVRLTDEASGQEKWLYFSSTFRFEFLFDPDTGIWGNSRGIWYGWPRSDDPAEWYAPTDDPVKFTRYALTAEQGGFSLTVTPGVLPPVPEPATLALAGLGLGVVGVRRVVRRG